MEDNPYVGLGNVTSLDLISFAYQIASGMVSYQILHNRPLSLHSKFLAW